ncbi:MAG TPA: acyl carrier protein [Deltaproteobacteria bacterium]|jgi:acyl carrier protein|nr:MAG: acyl carrier protein [delta proteobacterium MLS_D]HET58159.1 acyl carrier protein [Deltaproteobacteria bacterium]
MAVDIAIIEEKVKEAVINQLNITEEEYRLDAAFIDDLGADSLDIVEMVMAMEDIFGIEIADEDLEKIRYVRDVVEYLKQRVA